MFRLTPVVTNLLILNVGIFLGASLLGMHEQVVDLCALYYFESDNFQPWQFVTYMFLHANFRHIFGNMLGLIIFGTWLEEVWGSKRFLQYYMITGIGAAVLFMGADWVENRGMKTDVESFLVQPNPDDFELVLNNHFNEYYKAYYSTINPVLKSYAVSPGNEELELQAVSFVKELREAVYNVPMLGASGAIFGLLLAAGILFPNRQLLLFFVIPIKTRILVILYGAYTFYASIQQAPGDSVAHLAHLTGMLVGFVLLLMWGEARNRYQ